MRSFTINKNDSGQRLDKFLSKAMPLLPPSLLYKYIRIKRVKLNGRRAEEKAVLTEGDVLECYINDEFFTPEDGALAFLAAPADVDIVYEDENIALLNKPAGLLVHDDDSGCSDTLINRFLHRQYEAGEYDPKAESSFAPALCNRIDRNTCGIVIAAKNAEALRLMNDKIRSREIDKKYLCIVHGEPAPKSGVLEGVILKDSATNTVRVLDHPVPGGRTAKTAYRVLERRGDLCLVEAALLTGRTHQIRAQFAAAGHPLVGDTKYGRTDGSGISWQALCSYRLTFSFTTDAGALGYLGGRSFAVKDAWFLERFGFKMPKQSI